MASLSELVQAAQATQQARDTGNSTANAVHSGLQGIFAGMQAKRQAEKDAFERSVKLVDIQEKMAKIEETRQNMKIQGNFAKAFGVLPLDANESTNARTVANDAIGGPQKPKVNSALGKVLSKLQELEPDRVGFGKQGFSYSFSKPDKKRTPRDPSDVPVRNAVWQRATDMAMAEIQKQPITDFSMPKRTKPSQDEIWKYVPSAAKYYGVDPKVLGEPPVKAVDENDPLSGLDDLFPPKK